jgi:hypothetical protein
MGKKIAILPIDKYIRIEVGEWCDYNDIIKQISRNIDGISNAYIWWDKTNFKVGRKLYEKKAYAILDLLEFQEKYPKENNIIRKDNFNNYKIISYIEDNLDFQKEYSVKNSFFSDKACSSNLDTMGVVEVLAERPYIKEFSTNMSEELKNAFSVLSTEIIKAKKENPIIFDPIAE